MGICLDTDQQQNGTPGYDGGRGREAWLRGAPAGAQDERFSQTPPEEREHAHNGGHVKFEVPKVPVIFVLGGPGSGKVTHCDNLMQEKRGITHINMTDLLQQYAIGNDMKDFGQLSSKTVTEVLMLEMKMAPAAKTYLVSGYPRNMRDVVEYSEKIQIVNGVVLVSWRQKVLERQIDYGAKLGHVVLSLAKMELNNFYKNVMPVADFFDQRGMLFAVNGEREPNLVYKDFRAAVLKLLGMQEQMGNGVGGGGREVTGHGGGIPASRTVGAPLVTPVPVGGADSGLVAPKGVEPLHPQPAYRPPNKGFPPVLWIIGGPGSNKSSLCQKAVRQAPGWVHCSVGRLLRAAAETTDPRHGSEAPLVRQAIAAGEMVSQTYVLQLVESQMRTNMSAQGILMDGFPRDLAQVHDFENKFNQQPAVVLLDCSKLQLGRGRVDDSVAAFRRRLELFRELTLPLLKALDAEGRLTIVDGDTDTPAVEEEFLRVVLQHVEHVKRTGGLIVPKHAAPPPGAADQPPARAALPAMPAVAPAAPILPHQPSTEYQGMLQDLDSDGSSLTGAAGRHMPNGIGGDVGTISGMVADGGTHLQNARGQMNGFAAGARQLAGGGGGGGGVGNGIAGGLSRLMGNGNGIGPAPSRPSRDTVQQMYGAVESYPMDSRL